MLITRLNKFLDNTGRNVSQDQCSFCDVGVIQNYTRSL